MNTLIDSGKKTNNQPTQLLNVTLNLSHKAQSIRMDLNKKSKPEQKTITASKGTP